jgi:hypothetical protein
MASALQPRPAMSADRHIVVVEDSVFFREAWRYFPNAVALTFEHPEALLAAAAADPSVLGAALCVVVDQYYEELSATTGVELAEALRAGGFARPIYLATSGPLPALPAAIDAQVGKLPEAVWELLEAQPR